MDNMTAKERTVTWVLAAVTAGAVAYSAYCLLADGILTWEMSQKEYLAMAGETAALLGLFVLVFRFSPSFGARAAGIAGIMAVFLWVHRAFAAVAVSGLYGGYLLAVGRWILGRRGGKGRGVRMHRAFLTGCVSVVAVFCLMSAVGVGRIFYLWVFVAVSAVAMAADWLLRGKGTIFGLWQQEGRRDPSRRMVKGAVCGNVRWNWGRAFLWAAVLTFFCVQSGRMNVAVDFDSLWYGVRSPYILDNGRGIYENMGTIGIVYTYSKGFEVLTLPLSVLPSFSFVTSFNLWLLAGILWLFARILEICAGGEERAAYESGSATAGDGNNWGKSRAKAIEAAVCFAASLPGIMNMGITAKSDVATLCFQMILFYEMLVYLKGESQGLWYGWAAFFFSWTMKPTALVFSAAIMGMSMVFFAAENRLGQRRNQTQRLFGEPGEGAFVFGISLLALGGIWARTFLITGVPVTSVFSSLLTKIGFEMKYPFNVQKIPNSSAGLSGEQWIKAMAKRVWGVLFNPQGPDMDHVILAWGSLGVWFCLCVCAACLFLKKRERGEEERRLDRDLSTGFWPFAACCAVSLLLLTQVDGNYFMLFYVLFAVYAFRCAWRLSDGAAVRALMAPGVLVIIFSGIIMTLTNWSWSVGFTPAAVNHRGYYDHRQEQRRQMVEAGNGQIWDILAKDPKNRLIAIGDHPQALAFPCNAQSYSDITGTWGNVVLVKYMDNFVEFMDYAKTDYVYAQAGYMGEDERAWSLTCDLIEYGVLIPVCFEQGNMLAKVDTRGERTQASVKNLEEFLDRYVRKEEG